MVPMKQLISHFYQMDGHLREVLTGASIAFVVRGMGAAMAFLLNVIIGRLLGVEGAGLYFLALSVTMICSVIARLGMENVLLRFIAANAALNDWGRVKGIFALGLSTVVVASVVGALGLAIAAPFFANTVFSKPELTPMLRWMSFAVFSFSMMILLAESLKGLKRIAQSMLVSGGLYPLVALLLIWPFVQWAGPVGACMAYTAGTIFAAGLGMIWWRQAVAGRSSPPSPFSSSELWASARPFWLMMLINKAIIPWAPVFLLGVYAPLQEAGIFGAATRVVMLVSFFLVAVNTILTPKISELYVLGEFDKISQLAVRMTLALIAVSSPFFLVLVFAGDFVMRLFGTNFATGGTTLAILAIGQAFTVFGGSAGAMLMMMGHEKKMSLIALAASVILIGACLFLIPRYGMIGAAIANVLSMGGLNLGLILFAWKIINHDRPVKNLSKW